MRITANIVGAGKRWFADFPFVNLKDVSVSRGEKTVMIPDLARRALNQPDYILNSSDDSDMLVCVVANWASKINEWIDGKELEKNAQGVVKTMQRLKRRAETGMTTQARATFKRKRGADGTILIWMDVDWRNENIVEKKKWEEVFASVMVEAAVCVGEELVDCGRQPLELSERAKDLYERLLAYRKRCRDRREIEEANRRRHVCMNNNGGICSPVKCDCRHYLNGNCVDVNYDGKGGEEDGL